METIRTETEIIVEQDQLQKKRLTCWRHRRKPKTLKQLSERVEEYFDLCQATGMVAGLEGLALCVGVSRQTLFRWCKGLYCDPEWQQIVLAARQTVYAGNEQRLLDGSTHPASAIFALKAINGWKDTEPLDREIEGTAIEYARPTKEMLMEYKQVLGIADKGQQDSLTETELSNNSLDLEQFKTITDGEMEVIMFR